MRDSVPSTYPAPAHSLAGWLLHTAARHRLLARLGKAGHVAVLHHTRGRLLSRWFGSPVLVLETVGRKSGKRRRTTMTYCHIDGNYIVVAINAGALCTPAWWLNLRASGQGTILVGGRHRHVAAREAEGAERQRLWSAYAKQTPLIEEFREYADRDIPVVVLKPRDGA